MKKISDQHSHLDMNSTPARRPLAVALASLLGAISAAPAVCQEGERPRLEEVVVTASKRGESNLQTTAVAVQVMSGRDLEEKLAYDFADFAGEIPGLQFQDLGPGDKEYVIRGINSSGPSTVGVYFDEAVVTGGNQQDGGGRNIDIKLVDIERIEVLNGPQGTLYGANSMSGIIRYLPQKPDMTELHGFVDLDISTTDGGSENVMGSGMINIPVSDTLAVRLVGWGVDNSGWIDQTRIPTGVKKDINDEETTGGRIMVRYEPTSALTVDLSYMRQDTDVGGSSRYTPKGVTSFGDPASGFPPIVTPDDYINTDITQSPWEDEAEISSLTVQYEFSSGTLLATVNNFERDLFFSFDSSPILFSFGVPTAGITMEPQTKDIFSSEIRYSSSLDGPINFLVGAFQQKEDFDFGLQVLTVTPDGTPDGVFEAGPENDFFSGGNVFFGRNSEVELDQEAVFGEIAMDIADRWHLLVGARYFQYDISGSEQVLHDFTTGETLPANNNEDDQDKVTGKVSLSYDWSDDKMLYLTWSEGFRVGGLNDVSFGTNVPRSYEPDELTNYELGFKTTWMDNRVRLNGAIYRIDWDDTQVSARDATSGVPFITNSGSARINGIEISSTMQMTDSLYIGVGGSYTDAELTSDQPPVDPGEDRGLDGDSFPNVAPYQAYAHATYTADTSLGQFSIRGDVNYRSSTDIMFDTSNPLNTELDSYIITNLIATLEMGSWKARLYAKNLLNERAEYDAISSFQDPLAMVSNRPRTIGIAFRKDF